MSDANCEVTSYDKGSWASVRADFERRQYYQQYDQPFNYTPPFNSSIPFNETLETKHVPYISVHDDGVTASVLVGKEGISVGIGVHPMDSRHFITEIYIMDNMDNVIHMSSLDPTGVKSATITFDIPKGVSTLTAYSWCNLHGHWVGPTVEL